MTNMSDVVNNTPEGKKAVEKAVKQSIADQEAMSDTQPNVDELLEELRQGSEGKYFGTRLTPDGKETVEMVPIEWAVETVNARTRQAKKDLLAELLNLYGEPRCENLHHPKKWQHEVMKDCPVVAAIKEIEEGL